MAQQVKASAAKAYNLSSDNEINVVEGHPISCLLTCTHTRAHVHPHFLKRRARVMAAGVGGKVGIEFAVHT